MSSPKISIIIPVYNVEKYLKDCMDSVVNQTYKDIEIICVNDCSADNSLDILNEYAEKDSRIIVINKPVNQGLLSARKTGVAAANGEYIIFLDSDDYIKADLCKFIADITQKYDNDIIQFNIDVKNYSGEDKNVLWLRDALQPKNVVLKNDRIITDAYIDRKHITSLVGKIFKSEICKKVYSIIPDEHCYVGEDIFTYFIFACNAKSYRGITTDGYYVYRYGLGVENSDKMPLSKFEQYCKMSNWVKYAKEYLEKISGTETQYKALDKMAQRMCEDCCSIYKNRINSEEKDAAEELLLDYWSNVNITANVVKDRLDTTLEKMLAQRKVPVYTKLAQRYNDDTKPDVSVVVPVYNVELYLKQCLDSLVNQTLKNIEIVCVNDGSADNSLSIIEQYAQQDDRITVVSRKNGGLSAARNSGAAAARGKYLYFLDSDDFIVPNALERMFTISEKEKLDILYFGVQNYCENNAGATDNIIDEYYDRRQFYPCAVSGEKLFEKFIAENMFVCCVPFQFFNADFFKKCSINFKEGILHEDELFSPQIILKAERAMVIEDKLYMRRIREESITTAEATYKNFIGYFTAYATLSANAILNCENSKTAKKSLLEYTKKLYNTSRRIYKQLSQQQKMLVEKNIPSEYYLLYQPVKECEKTLLSMQYRWGMVVTFIPRKLAATINSYKKYGLKGVIQLICKYYF